MFCDNYNESRANYVAKITKLFYNSLIINTKKCLFRTIINYCQPQNNYQNKLNTLKYINNICIYINYICNY